MRLVSRNIRISICGVFIKIGRWSASVARRLRFSIWEWLHEAFDLHGIMP